MYSYRKEFQVVGIVRGQHYSCEMIPNIQYYASTMPIAILAKQIVSRDTDLIV